MSQIVWPAYKDNRWKTQKTQELNYNDILKTKFEETTEE